MLDECLDDCLGDCLDELPGTPVLPGENGVTRRVLAGLLLLPLVELVVTIQLGRLIGAGPTVLLILIGMLLGVLVLRREGSGALGDLRAAQQRLAPAGITVTPEGGVLSAPPGGPRRRPADRLLVVLAGVLLLVPGLVSDVPGLALLIPAVRRWVGGRTAAAARRRGWPGRIGAGAGRVGVRVVCVDDLPTSWSRSGQADSGEADSGEADSGEADEEPPRSLPG